MGILTEKTASDAIGIAAVSGVMFAARRRSTHHQTGKLSLHVNTIEERPTGRMSAQGHKDDF